ncbi:unnamed protein product [Ostreobium quekettii]|uniref:Uncharacterized protein n=1 Tax=Ostreobium quekettii TaxID=121088 RepID=A0A8S1ILZ7_9CHLO|nr:unnamed protein product [Ostreobium quekettii]|eukprot:evm.model.scf_3363.3 EVM.evm.TU.scf_3363.3   scf_3363:10531-13689(+)
MEQVAGELSRRGEAFLALFSDAEEREAQAAVGAGPSAYSDHQQGGALDADAQDCDEQGMKEVKKVPRRAEKHRGGKKSKAKTASSTEQLPWQGGLESSEKLDRASALAAERRNFMSGKTEKIHSSTPAPEVNEPRKGQIELPEAVSLKQQIEKLEYEVYTYGAKSLTKKERKRFKEEQWTKLGGKPKKREKIPVKAGINLLRKRENERREKLAQGVPLSGVDRRKPKKRRTR